MKWIMFAALWNTNPPQDSFKFITNTFSSSEACEEGIQVLYDAAFNKGIQAQAVCQSEQQLGLVRSYN